MDHSIRPRLDLNVPKMPSPERGGGAWPLTPDHVAEYAWWDDAFSSQELDAIVEIGRRTELHRATTFGGSAPEIRNSFVSFLFPNEVTSWVFARLTAVIMEVNARYFGFILTSMEQGLQFTQYCAPADHYEWHMDRGQGIATRKLSLSLQLSQPDGHEGGDLQIMSGKDPQTVERKRGRISLFPSWAMHRVTPVTSGTRHSLVAWVGGPDFK